MNAPLSRRNLLRGLGGIAVALPFLESLVNPRKVARAGASGQLGHNGRPKRFVAWVNMFGTLPQFHRVEHNGTELHFPSGLGPDPFGSPKPEAPPYFQVYNPDHWPQIETSSTQQTLDKVKQHLTVLKGVNMASMYKANGPKDFVGHASGACQALTGRPDLPVVNQWGANVRMPLAADQPPDGQGRHNTGQCYPSIDQAIANRIDTSGAKYRSLRVGDNLDHAEQLFYGEGEDLGNVIWNPLDLFKNVFAEFQTQDTTAIDALREQRRSVLDAVREQAKAFEGRVSQRDRYVIQSHFDAVRDIEKSLDVVASCSIPAGIVEGLEGVQKWQDFIAQDLGTKRYELFFKLIALALKCDLTRVAGVQFSGHTLRLNDIVTGFDVLSGGNNQGIHGYYNHAVWSDVKGTEINRQVLQYKNRMFADFIADLASADEGGHSVLDNTIVYQTTEQLTGLHEVLPTHVYGYGNQESDSSPMRSTSLNTMIAGGGGGALKPGNRLLDFRDSSQGYNPDRYAPDFGHHSHGEVMLTLARAMGVTPEQLPSFGMPEVCQGEIAELLTGV